MTPEGKPLNVEYLREYAARGVDLGDRQVMMPLGNGSAITEAYREALEDAIERQRADETTD